MESNPYNSPSANLFGSSSQTTAETVPSEAITELQGTKFWVRIMSVLMWLGAAYLVVTGLFMALGMAMGGAVPDNPFGSGLFVGLGVFYLLLAFAYIFPAIKLWQYGSSIKSLVLSRSAGDLVAALRHQRIFWKYAAIVFILLIVLGILALISAIVFAATGALNNLAVPK